MTAAPFDPAGWSRVARAKHRHYLQTVVPSGNELAVGLHERRLAALVPLLCDAIDELVKASATEPGTCKTVDLIDEALAATHRWHAIVHPVMAEAGVFEPERNPSGCAASFCLNVVTECVAVAAPLWFEAGIREGRSQLLIPPKRPAASSPVEWYEIHDHGLGTEWHSHSTEMHHTGDVNNSRADDHAGLATMPWEEWKTRVRGDAKPVPAKPPADTSWIKTEDR